MVDSLFNKIFDPLLLIVGGPILIIVYHVFLTQIFDNSCREIHPAVNITWLYEDLPARAQTVQDACAGENFSTAPSLDELQKVIENLLVKNTLQEEHIQQILFQREQTIKDSKLLSIELEDGLMRERDEHERFCQYRQSKANDLHEKERNRIVQKAAQQHQKHQEDKAALEDNIKILKSENGSLKEYIERREKRTADMECDAEVIKMRETLSNYQTRIEFLQNERTHWKYSFRHEKQTADAAFENIRSLEENNNQLALWCRELKAENDELRAANKREVGKASRARDECARLRYEASQQLHEATRHLEMREQFGKSINIVLT